MSDPVEEAAKLPLNQRLEHSHWKVRSVAYEELAKKYNEALESTSSIFNEYSGYFKKMMNDKNAAAMEKGLEPIYGFYDRYDHASKFTASLAPLIIEKCLGARQGTKQRATELLLLMVEVDTSAEAVVVALVEGAGNKVPKVAITSIQTLELILKTFGVKVVPLKPILTNFLTWFDHTNAEARAAAQTFTIELYRWVGGAILDKPISNLRQAQVTELQKAFADIVKGAAVPEKYLRCQVDQMQAAAAAGSAPPQVEEVDVYAMVEAVNVISKITPDMYEMLQSKKWKDKKETLEAINKIADTPRLASGEYGELVKNLKRLLGDANVFVVEESVKLLGFLARGLRADFGHFAKNTMGTLLDKLKEKKDKVITALQGTFDAYHPHCFAMADVMEDILTASKHKVPQVKKELLNWIKRALPKEKRPLLTKSLKTWCTLFMELMDDSDSPVRENAFECFGLLIGMLGERSLTGYINQLDKVKEKRVREFIPTAPIPPPTADASSAPSAAAVPTIDVNANVNLSNVATKKSAAVAAEKKAPAASSATKKTSSTTAPAARASIAKPVSGGSGAASSSPSSSTAALSASSKPVPVETFNPEPRVSAGDAESRVTDYVPDNLVAQLGDKDWKQRLDAISVVASMVERWDSNTASENAEGLLLFLVVARPSFKEPNVQVLAKMTEVLKRLCSVQRSWNKNDVYVTLAGVLDHIHEAKLTSISLEFLNTVAENPTLGVQFVFNALYGLTKDQKAPKVIVESMAYMSTALSEFGGSMIEMRNLVTFIKTVALEHTNATIKATGIRVLCEVYKQMGGNSLMPLLSDVRPQLMTTAKKEFEKVANERPATPSRGPNGPAPGEGAASSSSPAASSAAAADIPRVDISNQINAAIPAFTNNDWQKRQEAMASIESAIIEARRIQPKGLSSLMMPLKARLADSNINLIPLALNILGELASATGPTIESHMKTVMPSILACYANGKTNVKTACSLCLDKWVNEVGLDPLLPYLPTALGTPSGRADLLGWISTKLGYVKKGDVKVLLKPALQCYQDKSKEVRAVAETTIIELARRLTPKVVEGECSKLAPAVLTQVRTLLKNNEAEIKKPVVAPQAAVKSKIPVPGALSGLPSGPSPVASPRVDAEPIAAPSSEPIKTPSPSPPAGPVLRNNKKVDRELEELAWVFDAPIPAKFIDALREQMVPCVTPDLLDRLFSNDAKSHNSAIADLQTCVDTQQAAVEDSLDVILKWCSLRLFSSNAAIVKRTVELIEHLIGSLDIWDHKLSELEAGSFIPVIVIRLPHLSESQQTSLRSILQSVEQSSYPASKIFKLFMNTSRLWTGSQLPPASRVECLRYLGTFIRRQSLSVCDPSEAFRVFSGLLSEDDSSVIIASLDVFAEAGKKLQEDESLWNFISAEHHDLVRAYIASPTAETLAKFNIGSPSASSQAVTAPAAAPPAATPAPSKIPSGPTKTSAPASAPAAAAEPAPSPTPSPAPVEEKPKEKPQPVLEKVSIAKSAQFSLDLDKLSVEPLPANLNLALPPGVNVTLLPSHISADPTPFLPSRQVSRTSADAQAQAQKQSQLMIHVQGWIANLKSSDSTLVLETLKNIHGSFQQDLRAFAFHVDPIVTALMSLWKNAFAVLNSSPFPTEVLSQMRVVLVDIVLVLFKDENKAQFVPESQIRVLLPLLVESMLQANDMPIEQGERQALIAQINASTVALLNTGNRTATLVALLVQLREKTPRLSDGTASGASTPFLDVIKKCLARSTKAIPSSLSKLALPTVLYEIHLFFSALPPHSWPRESNTALEAVKALLDKLVQVAGSAIVNHLGLVPSVLPPPAINWYVKTFLLSHCPGSSFPTLACSDVDPETSPTSSMPELSETSASSVLAHVQPKPAVPTPEYRLPSPAGADAKRQALTHVFQKISKKETSQQGLVDLYWLKKDHPDVEIEDFIRSTSSAFKSFISQQMKRITALDTLSAASPTEPLPRETIQTALQPAQDANAQLSRLRSLQSRLKLGKPSESIISTELEPSMLSAMAYGSSAGSSSSSSSSGGSSMGAGVAGSGVSATTGQHNQETNAAGKPIASISRFRELLKNASSSQADLGSSKFDLPSLSTPSIAPPTSPAPSQSSSFALPDLSSETVSAPSSRPNPATTASVASARVAPSSQIPSGPSVASAPSSGSTVDSLRERLAKIKGASAQAQ